MNTNNGTKRNAIQYQSGQVIMAAVLVFLTLSIVVVVGITTPIVAQMRTSALMFQTRKSITASDTLNDDALYRLNAGRTLPSTMVLALNEATATAQIITDASGNKQIISTGESGNTDRISKAVFSQGLGVSIAYGLQTGTGGLIMSGGPTVYGNVFSNGNIVASGGSTITGNATVSSTLSSPAYMQNDDGATSTPSGTIVVGRANDIQLMAQSFTFPTTSIVTVFSFYVKKTGSPANATLKIYNDNGGLVGSTQIGSSGSLSASQVGTSYDWVEVYPTSPITLTGGTRYWITIEYQGNNSKYYTFASNSGFYSDGSLKTKVKTGTSWGSYVDASPSNTDLIFSMASGVPGSISGININGSADAYIVNSSNIGGSLYCQDGSGNNKACDTSHPLPSPVNFPISAATIQSLKDRASAGTVRNSSWNIGGGTATSTPGPMKIVGDLVVSGGGSLTLNGPLYVTGAVKVEGGAHIYLASSYGSGDEFIVSTYVRLTGGGMVSNSGTSGSYVVIIADGTDCDPLSCADSIYAGTAAGGTGSIVLMVPNGTLDFSGGTAAKGAVAKTMRMSGGTTLTYEAGLASISFAASSSNAWTVQSWKEIEQ